MRRTLLALLLVSAGACAPSPAEREARAGVEAAKAGDVAGAIEHFQRSLDLDPGNAMARFNLGLAHLYMEQWIVAEEQLRRFVELRPDDARGHFELARARALAGWPQSAIDALKRAVELGFADYELLVSDGVFRSLYGMPQYVALEMTVAQRAGVEPKAGVLAAPGGEELGPGTTTLPGLRLPQLQKPCARGDATCGG